MDVEKKELQDQLPARHGKEKVRYCSVARVNSLQTSDGKRRRPEVQEVQEFRIPSRLGSDNRSVFDS
jgi:hypothetical protein